MAHSPHKRWKGCCMMCNYYTLRGQGEAYKLPHRDLKKLGRKRRIDKNSREFD